MKITGGKGADVVYDPVVCPVRALSLNDIWLIVPMTGFAGPVVEMCGLEGSSSGGRVCRRSNRKGAGIILKKSLHAALT